MTLPEFLPEIYADGASSGDIRALRHIAPIVVGFTTNPTLMRRAGVTDYLAFAEDAARAADGLPISFEVVASDPDGMVRQAHRLAEIGANVYVKIPVMDVTGRPTADIVGQLLRAGVQVNVTAVFTPEQAADLYGALDCDTASIVSVFAGRIADTGVDPIPVVWNVGLALAGLAHTRVLWASTRELLNIWHARLAGADIITVPTDLLTRLGSVGKNLTEFSLETVRMFDTDARRAGYVL